MIELTKLQKMVERDLLVDVASLTVAEGEIVALLGPPGSDRALLWELLIGRTRPTAGAVRLAAIDPFDQRDLFSQRVGVLFAEDCLYQRHSTRNNLAFHCRLRGLPRSRADEVLVQIGLADHARVKIDKLAPGLARRLALGCAMLHEPAVLLALEPFARCEEASVDLVGDVMRQLADGGAAVLLLGDDTPGYTALCDRIFALARGRVVETPSPRAERRSELPFKVPVRLEDRVILLNPVDILYAEAESGQSVLHTSDRHLPTQFTLAELEERLGRSGFFRAHRSYLVNLQHVREVIPYTRNSFSLRLDDEANTEIPLSKSSAAELRDLLGY
ncbi:MAG TPA: LytR family transcriptional regulator [Chloroflexi bacterium]|nr:LytR family transcriptional regulator [Chloroflexota bacterium]